MGFNMKDYAKNLGLKTVLSYLDSDPIANMPKVLEWVKRFDSENHYEKVYKKLDEVLSNPDNVWHRYIVSLYSDIDSDVRKKLFNNFLLNSAIEGTSKKRKAEAKYDCNIPWAILMDPTSACNLKCKGCWAAEYGNKLNMDLKTLDSIITQGKKLGTYMYIYSGGEPLIRKDDIITLCRKHNDCAFLAFTNSTLIDENFAKQMLSVKNFIPAISIEGYEEETDFRRGEGTYKATIRAMEVLKKYKLPFGISCCYTSTNTDIIGSEKYIDDMISKGAKFAWFFTYMPVGKDAVPELLATAEQREFMYHQIRKFRKTKPIWTMDFWNDGEYIDGCIAGGRYYLHINANGDIEPCAFIHYSDSNIYEKTLLEAYRSPLFMGYRRNQPFNKNMLRPCPVLDNPGALTKIVNESGSKSTDLQNPDSAEDFSNRCVEVSKRWAPVADRLWKDSGHE